MTLKAAYLSFEQHHSTCPEYMHLFSCNGQPPWALNHHAEWGLVFWLSSFLIQELHTKDKWSKPNSHNPEWQKEKHLTNWATIASWPSRLYPTCHRYPPGFSGAVGQWCAMRSSVELETLRGEGRYVLSEMSRAGSPPHHGPWNMGSNQSTIQQWPWSAHKIRGAHVDPFQVFIC